MAREKETAPAAGTDGAGYREAIYIGQIVVTQIDPEEGAQRMFPLGASFKLTAGQVDGTEDLFISRLRTVQVAAKSLDDLDVVRKIAEISP